MTDMFSVPESSPVTDGRVTARLLILGLGNPMMADDGIGHEVVLCLNRCELPKGVRVFAVDGDVLTLIDLWKGEPAVWLVDAVSTDAAPGTRHIFEHQDLLELPPAGLSVHHPSIGENLRWMVHAHPGMNGITFRLFGVEVGVVQPATRMTRAATKSVTRLVDDITIAVRELAAPVRYSPH